MTLEQLDAELRQQFGYHAWKSRGQAYHPLGSHCLSDMYYATAPAGRGTEWSWSVEGLRDRVWHVMTGLCPPVQVQP